MKRNIDLIFIGPLGLGAIPQTGDTFKNQMLHERFLELFSQVVPVDTFDWQEHPWILFRLVLVLLLYPKAKIVVSANSVSANKILRFVETLRPKNDVYYWVIGGMFHKMIEDGTLSTKAYKSLRGVFVEGVSMVKSLQAKGIFNVTYVPNFKRITHFGINTSKKDELTHFVFMSRVEEHKGCTDIIKSVDILNKNGYHGKYDVTFYGRESQDPSYSEQFIQMVRSHPEVEYRGLLNLKDTDNYDVLSKFDVMLFPTYWIGEGFPGIIIDAYIASLPIVASDWHLNKDIIEDGKTGWIIPPHDVDALAQKMAFAIDNPGIVESMSQICRKKAEQYDSSVVLSEENLKLWGILD